jgi:hypothetical protein
VLIATIHFINVAYGKKTLLKILGDVHLVSMVSSSVPFLSGNFKPFSPKQEGIVRDGFSRSFSYMNFFKTAYSDPNLK